MSPEQVEVAVVGGGPAGLAAATELRRRGCESVVVFEREQEAGGIPRHAKHQGFGVRDLRRVMSGPAYAKRWVELAELSGVEIRTQTQVTGWSEPECLDVTSPSGRSTVEPQAVVLATGCRERPRSARLVPGTRPQGVMTTGTLQQLVYLHGEQVGSRAVVVGAEHVSYSALLTLAHGGAKTVAMVTDHPRHQSLPPFSLGAAARFRVRARANTTVSQIFGRKRVEGVELTDIPTGQAQRVACDIVVFTADWIPDHELAVSGGTALDPGTRGPQVDSALRSTRRGVFAAGNLLHGAETADVAALTGRHAAAGVLAYLREGRELPARTPIGCDPPLSWVVPNAVATGDRESPEPARGRFLVRATHELKRPTLEFVQAERVIARQRLRRVGPGRSARLDWRWVEKVEASDGAVTLRVVS